MSNSRAPEASPPWTVRRVLQWMQQDLYDRGFADARLDAELLIAHGLGVDRVRLYMDFDKPLGEGELAVIRSLFRRRRQHEPMAYIRGVREFFGRDFEVSPAVLVPRPETELLVERALAVASADALHVLDLCTGSGAVAVTLAAERAVWGLVASDISRAALDVARANAVRHQVQDRVTLCEGDLFAALADQRFDLIVANPPYIAERDWHSLPADVADFEPRQALAAGAEGLDMLARIVAECGDYLVSGGRLLMEMGAGQSQAVAAMIQRAPHLEFVAAHADLAGIPRLAEAVKA